MSSGSSALYLAYKAIGIKPGDKVLIPSFTFIATGEMLIQSGAIPVWVDSNLEDYTVDIDDLSRKISKDIKAIVAIDLFGHVCNYDEIIKIASSYNIPIIQDAAQSFGSKFKNKITGSYTDITCFSFRPAKNLYCMGDGGGVVSKNKKYIDTIKMACDHGRTDKYVHEFIGWNMRLDAIQANIMNKLIIYVNDNKSMVCHKLLMSVNFVNHYNGIVLTSITTIDRVTPIDYVDTILYGNLASLGVADNLPLYSFWIYKNKICRIELFAL